MTFEKLYFIQLINVHHVDFTFNKKISATAKDRIDI